METARQADVGLAAEAWKADETVVGPRLVAVIPAFNEDKYIASVVLKVRRQVDQVVVVDDGSSDLTRELAREAGATVLAHPHNQGKGAAVRTGLQWALEAGAEAGVLLDGDGQHHPDDIERVVAPILAGDADMVVGSRFIGEHARTNIPRWRVLGQRVLNTATAIGSGHSLTDSQSGFRAFSRRAMQLMSGRLRSDGFSIESEMQVVAREHGLRTVETPIIADYDVPLKRNPLAHALEVLNGLLKLVGQARPLLFISLPGLVLLALGLLLGMMVVSIYSNTHQLAIGYSLLTMLLGIVGLLALFTGIMLHTMRALFLQMQSTREPPWE